MTVSRHAVAYVHAFAGLLAASLVYAGSSAASAGPSRPVSVVELFTSQGCSSCPPADKLMRKYSRRNDVIALTFNVDYWDYLGWKDTLARPAYSARQRAYAKARGDGQVYTPQVVVNGVRHVVGSDEADIERAISATRSRSINRNIPLSMSVEGDTLVIKAGAAHDPARSKPATIWLALIKKEQSVTIARGENRGRKITYYSIVRELTPVGHWTGEAVTIKLPKHHLMSRGSDGCTVLLQVDTAGAILAAAELKDW